MQFLAAGQQAAAEQTIELSIKRQVRDREAPEVEEVFLMAVMTRSRFEVEEAAPLFAVVSKDARVTPHTKAAGCILRIDTHTGHVGTEMKGLRDLSEQNPNDPLLLWMIGVECRSLQVPDMGIKYYAELCKLWDPGPVLVHQTYANLLDDLKKYDEALPHRKLAVKLEPSPWAYDGLGNTLTSLKKWDEADDAYSHSTGMEPNNPHNWKNWIDSMRERGDAVGTANIEAKAKAALSGHNQ